MTERQRQGMRSAHTAEQEAEIGVAHPAAFHADQDLVGFGSRQGTLLLDQWLVGSRHQPAVEGGHDVQR